MHTFALILILFVSSMIWSISPSYAQATDPAAEASAGRIDGSSTDIRFWERRSCPKPSDDEIASALNMIDTQSGKKGDRHIPEGIITSHRQWYDTYVLWTIIWYALLGLSILGSGLAASVPKIWPTISTIAALTATISTSAIGVINPQAERANYLTGWLDLTKAFTLYRSDPNITLCHVINVYVDAENTIHGNLGIGRANFK